MTQENVREPVKRRPLWVKAVIVAIACIALGGVGVILWKVTHKESEEAGMRRLISRLGAKEFDITFVDAILYTTHRRQEARKEVLAAGKRAVPFLIEGLHHEDGYVAGECAELLIRLPTKQGVAALIQCLSEEEKPVPLPSDIQFSLAAITGYRGGLDLRTFDDTRDKEKARRVWEQWWAKYKDRLVETPRGLGIRSHGGLVVPLPCSGWDP